MPNAAHILFEEFEAIRLSGSFGGESLANKRTQDLGFSTTSEYFAYLLDNSYRLQQMLNQVEAAGITTRSFTTLRDECLNAVFGLKTGWGSTQSNGVHRVEFHTVNNLESFAAFYDNMFRSSQLEDSRCLKIKEELDALRAFVKANSPEGPNQAVLLASIDDALRLLDQEEVDHAVLSGKLSALIGLLVLFAGAHKDEKQREKWFDRVKTGAFIFGSELFVGITTDMGSAAIQQALGITP